MVAVALNPVVSQTLRPGFGARNGGNLFRSSMTESGARLGMCERLAPAVTPRDDRHQRDAGGGRAVDADARYFGAYRNVTA